MFSLVLAGSVSGANSADLTPYNVNARLQKQLRAAGALLENETSLYNAGLRPLADLLRADKVGACMPSDRDIRKHAPGLVGLHMPHKVPFFLDESDGLEMRAVHACLEAQLVRARQSVDSTTTTTTDTPVFFDDILPPNKAAYLSDLLLLRALRLHPQRVHDPTAAIVHFTGLTPHASLVANYSCARVTGESHEERMHRAATALRKKAELAARTNMRQFIVIMHPSWNWRALGSDVRELLRERALSGRFLLATGDRTYAAHFSSPLKETATIIPYTASARLDRLARREYEALKSCATSEEGSDNAGPPGGRLRCTANDWAPLQEEARAISIYFVGNMHRQRGEGKVRFKAVEGFSRGSSQGKYVDRIFRRQNVHGLSFAQMAMECAREMRNARFCLAPAGDVPTSRRLPDAMAAGCIPVYIGRFELMRYNLPFPHHVDWGACALFVGSVECLERTNTSAALGALLEAIDPTLLGSASTRLRAEYARTLSFERGGGALDALLQEIYIVLERGKRWQRSRQANHAAV